MNIYEVIKYRQKIAKDISILWNIPYEKALKLINKFIRNEKIEEGIKTDILRIISGLEYRIKHELPLCWSDYIEKISKIAISRYIPKSYV